MEKGGIRTFNNKAIGSKDFSPKKKEEDRMNKDYLDDKSD
jgi:hypothetical protein